MHPGSAGVFASYQPFAQCLPDRAASKCEGWTASISGSLCPPLSVRLSLSHLWSCLPLKWVRCEQAVTHNPRRSCTCVHTIHLTHASSALPSPVWIQEGKDVYVIVPAVRMSLHLINPVIPRSYVRDALILIKALTFIIFNTVNKTVFPLQSYRSEALRGQQELPPGKLNDTKYPLIPLFLTFLLPLSSLSAHPLCYVFCCF